MIPSAKIAVIAHLYYLEEALHIIDKCEKYHNYFDFYFTLPDFGYKVIESKIHKQLPKSIICKYENAGADILPFFKIILENDIVANYSSILKLHTKKFVNVGNQIDFLLGRKWFEYNIKTLLPNEVENFKLILNVLDNDCCIGPHHLLLNAESNKIPFFRIIEKSFNIKNTLSDKSCFFAGSMFYSSTKYLKFIQNIDLNNDHFYIHNNIHDLKAIHYFERYFGHLPFLDNSIYTIDSKQSKFTIHRENIANITGRMKINFNSILSDLSN